MVYAWDNDADFSILKNDGPRPNRADDTACGLFLGRHGRFFLLNFANLDSGDLQIDMGGEGTECGLPPPRRGFRDLFGFFWSFHATCLLPGSTLSMPERRGHFLRV